MQTWTMAEVAPTDWLRCFQTVDHDGKFSSMTRLQAQPTLVNKSNHSILHACSVIYTAYF